MNPFQPLYDDCNRGDSLGKYARLPDFPRIIDVEVTSACNFRCLMCPTGNLSLKRKPEFMDKRTFERIVLQCFPRNTAIRLIGWGEPLMHPNVVEFVASMRMAKVLSHINTNGSHLTMGMALGLANAGLDSIKFSFQGVDQKSYAEMRNTDFFEGMIEAIRRMKEARAGRERPYIAASTSITYETPDMVETFKARLEPFVDHLSIGRTIFDFMDLSAVRLKPDEVATLTRLKELASDEKIHPDPCPEVYDKLSIHASGDVVVCCNDFDGITDLGNVNDTAIVDMWCHPTIEAYRKRLAQKDYDAPLCKDCYDYQGLTQAP